MPARVLGRRDAIQVEIVPIIPHPYRETKDARDKSPRSAAEREGTEA